MSKENKKRTRRRSTRTVCIVPYPAGGGQDECIVALWHSLVVSNDDFAALFTSTCTAYRLIRVDGGRALQRDTPRMGRRGVLREDVRNVIDASVERRVNVQTDGSFSDAIALRGDRMCGLWYGHSREDVRTGIMPYSIEQGL